MAPRLVEGGRLALDCVAGFGCTKMALELPVSLSWPIDLVPRSARCAVLDRSSFELEADEVLLIAPANARAEFRPRAGGGGGAPAGRHLLVVGDEVEVVLIRPVVPDILFPLDSSPE